MKHKDSQCEEPSEADQADSGDWHSAYVSAEPIRSLPYVHPGIDRSSDD